MKRLFFFVLVLIGLFIATPVHAQTTLILTDTAKAAWGPSPDEGNTFNGAPLVSSYRGEIYLKSAVVAGVPSGTPAFSVDWGKPPVVAGEENGPALKPIIQPNIEYYVFLRAVGPGGVSPLTAGVGPFGFPSAPKPAGAVRIVP